jgi:hypothetical protein
MVTIDYRQYRFRADPDRTREAYECREVPDWGVCCDTCENFEVALEGGHLLPTEVIHLFDRLGVDVFKAAEQFELADVRPGWHDYSVFYHFVGELISGPNDCGQSDNDSGSLPMETVTDKCRVCFSHNAYFLNSCFTGHPVVQIELWVTVPWLLSQPPYTRGPGQTNTE